MIERLDLKNFQPWEKLTVKFGQITTIIGPTDAGKSSIIRALAWLFLNQPSGKSMIREGTKEAGARTKVAGHMLVRKRNTTSLNEYKLDEEKLKSFGQGVPKAVEETFRVSERSFQMQTDPHFWVSMKPPELARELNRIVDLDVMDQHMADIAKQRRAADARQSLIGERLQDAEQELSELPDLEAARARFEKLQEAQQRVSRLSNQTAHLRDALEDVDQQKAICQRAAEQAQWAEKVIAAGEEAARLQNEHTALLQLTRSLRRAQATVAAAPPESAFRTIKAIEKRSNVRRKLKRLLDDIERGRTDAEKASAKADALEKQIAEETEGQCPVCGSAM